jgi:putative ABC transport system ATP-binding protein
MIALHLEKVTKVYRKGENEIRALDGIDLDIETGEFLTVVGPSGSGRSPR